MFYSGYQCDKCGKTMESKARGNEWLPNKTTLTRFARDGGWSVGNQVLCPNCRHGKKREDLYDEHK